MLNVAYYMMGNGMREVYWVGSSLRDLKRFPEAVKDELGYILWLLQKGDHHSSIKPLKGLSGVYEIRSEYDKDCYRAVYALKIGEFIYVLHAFKKKSKKGIKTPKEEIDVIKSCYQIVVKHAKENQQNG